MENVAALPPLVEDLESESHRMVHVALGQNRVLEWIAMGRPIQETLDGLLRYLERDTPEMSCSILLLDEQGRHLRHCAAPSLPAEYCRMIDGSPIGPAAGSCGTAAFRGKQVVVADIERDPLWANYRALVRPYGYRACWSTPILDAEGKVLGTFAMYFKQRASPEPIHERLIKVALHVATIAIGRDIHDRERNRLTYELKERLKELSVRRRVDQELVVDRPLGQELLDRIVEILPSGWVYPEYCRARLQYGAWSAQSEGFFETPLLLKKKFSTRRGEGTIEVVYVGDIADRAPPDAPLEIFLPEEHELLDTLAEAIAIRLNRAHTEEALTESEERYRLINLATKDAVWDWDLLRGTLWWNDGVSLLFGYDRSEVSSDLSWWSERVHPQDRDRVSDSLHDAADSHQSSWNEEYRFLRKDGSYAFVQDRGHVMRDGHGKATRMIGMMQDVSAQKRADAQIRELAYQEPITRLPNRAALQLRVTQSIDHAQRAAQILALMLFNINCFRDINDSLGHQNGDILLRHVAERLCGVVGIQGEVASLGGDEFAILLPHVHAGDDVEVLLARIEEALRLPFQVGNIPIQVDATVGVALYPHHGTTGPLLWQHADVALRTAKEKYQPHLVYSPEIDHYDPTRLILLGELRTAIHDNQLVLHYQPKIDLKTGRTVGLEALVRWQHPTRGLIYPDTFIPLAERSGLINPLTINVVVGALRQGLALLSDGLTLGMSVNLSARNLHEPGFAKGLLDLVSCVGFPLSLLTLEITETAIMADPVRAKAVLSELRQAGIHLSMDDFGVGQSSLSYLKELPISKMKIDKSFIIDFEQPNNQAVVRSAVDLARNMGLQATAEGIETEQAYLTLRDLGCELGQGYFFSRPLPVDKLTSWITSSPFGADR